METLLGCSTCSCCFMEEGRPMPFVMGDDWGCGVKPELRFAFSLFSILNKLLKPAETLL